jgi:cardiolipin synthase (CMP-forming)
MNDRIITIPNILTCIRILLAPVVALLLFRQEFEPALWGLLLAGVTDGLDGFVAKWFNQSSRLGALLDPLADKLLMLATVLALTWIKLLPLWITVPILMRDLVILGGALIYYRRAGSIQMQPTLLSKANTCAQIGLLLLVVAIHGGILPLGRFLFPAFLLVLATTVTSGFQYVVVWWRKWRLLGVDELLKR